MGMRAHLIIICLTLILGSFLLQAQKLPNQHVLLIGVGKYPVATGWPELSSTQDIELIANTLTHFGIDESSIHRMSDQEVTRTTILKSIQKYLTDACKPGDLAIFHFSGHGQQIPDDDGDEPDGLDEALVPYDSPKFYKEGINEGQYLLRDDDLATALNAVRMKLGPKGQLFVSMDACHSGSATRGRVRARGSDIIMAPTGAQYQSALSELEVITADRELSLDKDGLAPAVYMYSSSPRQLSYEYDQDNQRYGLYTYALCQSLNSGGAESYMDLWNDLKQFVEARNSMQTPFAEGALRSPIFMRQGAPSSKNSFNVLQKHGNRTLIIDGGSLHGITAGSEVSVIDYTSKSVLSSGRIVQLRAFDTEIELNQAINLPAKESLRVRIDRVNYKEEGCNIQLIIDDRQLGKKVIRNLKNYALINKITYKNADYILSIHSIHKDSLTYLLQTGEGAGISTDTVIKSEDPDRWLQQMHNDLTRFVKAKRLIGLETMNDVLSARVFLNLSNRSVRPIEDSIPVLKNGQNVYVAVSNMGKEAFYFSVFHVSNSNEIQRLVPASDQNPADFVLDPGKTKIVLPPVVVTEPFGTDVLKVVCTRHPVHYGLTRGAGPSNPMKTLMDLLSGEEVLTRGKTASISSQQGFIGTYVFRTCN